MRFAAIASTLLSVGCAAAEKLPLDRIKLPPGFEIHPYATGVPNASSMSLSPGGTLFVGTMDEGNVYAVLDQDQDDRADKLLPVACVLERRRDRSARSPSRSLPLRLASLGLGERVRARRSNRHPDRNASSLRGARFRPRRTGP